MIDLLIFGVVHIYRSDFRIDGKALVLSDIDDTMIPLGTREGLDTLSYFLKRLRSVGVEVIPVTFKAFNELNNLMRSLDFRFVAMVAEGGCVIYSSNGLLRDEGSPTLNGYSVVELCKPISFFDDLLTTIERSDICGERLLRLSKSSATDISEFLGLPVDVVRDSQERFYSDAFITRETLCKFIIKETVSKAGLKTIITNRSIQVLGAYKEEGVREFLKRLNLVGRTLPIIGAGDSVADYGFLSLVDVPILISKKELPSFKGSQYIRSFNKPPDSWIHSVKIGLDLVGIHLGYI